MRYDFIDSEDAAVLYVYADWCEVCDSITPKIEALRERYSGRVNFYLLDADDKEVEEYLVSRNIEGVPFFSVIVSGYVISRQVGFRDPEGKGSESFLESFEDYLEAVFG